jgi:hypothetical protein
MEQVENDKNNVLPLEECRQVDDQLRGWIAERLLLGETADTVASSLRRNSIREDDIAAEIRLASTSPYVKGMKNLVIRHKRNEWLLNKYSLLNAMSTNRHTIDRRSGLQADEFFEEYYFRNRPVIMTDVVNDWPAFQRWGLEYFKEQFGDEQVEMQVDRALSSKQYGPYPSRFGKTISLREYVDLVTRYSPTNEIYLSRWNNKKCRSLVKRMAEDLRQWDFTGPMEQASVWIGPAGTITPLHYDAANILMAQMVGRKRIFIAPAYDGIHLRGESTVHYSDVNPAAIDHDAFPQAKHASFAEVILQPTELLFLPIGWWHAVTAMDISVTLTFENFIHEN